MTFLFPSSSGIGIAPDVQASVCPESPWGFSGKSVPLMWLCRGVRTIEYWLSRHSLGQA
ncbi:MAG: hypothetical protein K9K30_05805 [Burkholderiaceae bacterium]|nr:hypothetical protein [Sulfuritalea sp.]MCF8174741.1 hypothetical protein [Burkholderiaceae bacterium]